MLSITFMLSQNYRNIQLPKCRGPTTDDESIKIPCQIYCQECRHNRQKSYANFTNKVKDGSKTPRAKTYEEAAAIMARYRVEQQEHIRQQRELIKQTQELNMTLIDEGDTAILNLGIEKTRVDNHFATCYLAGDISTIFPDLTITPETFYGIETTSTNQKTNLP